MTSSPETRHQTLDELFRHVIGQFGPFQRRVVFIVSLISFSTAFNNLGYVFWAARPDFYHCIPTVDEQSRIIMMLNESAAAAGGGGEIDDDQMLQDTVWNLTIPWDDEQEDLSGRSRFVYYY